MAIVTLILNKQRRKQDNTFPVVLRVAQGGKRKLIACGCSVLETDWDDKKSIVKNSCKDHKRFNALIEDKRAEIMDQLTKDTLNDKVTNLRRLGEKIKSGSFSNFIQNRIEFFRGKENINMVYKSTADLRELELINQGEVHYDDLTPHFLQKLELYYRKEDSTQGKRVNSQNTIARKFKNMRTHYKAALQEDNAPYPNPFDLVRFNKEPVKRYKLTPEEVKRLEELELREGSNLCLARDLFLFSFYCQGMRFENCLKLRKEQIFSAKIHYQMNKGKKHRIIGLHPKLETIINKYYLDPKHSIYLFPLLEDKEYTVKELYHAKGSQNAKINESLKLIADLANIPAALSFHMAKHTFAFISKSRGVDQHAIKDALGHSTYAVMEEYLKSLDDDYIDAAVKKVFD